MFKTDAGEEQWMLLPKCIDDYIPTGYLARIICTIIEQLKIDKIISKYSRIDQNAYDPFVLIGSIPKKMREQNK